MTFLPIADRELRVRARWRSTYAFRFAWALIAILLSGWLLVASLGAPSGTFGMGLFRSMAWMAFFFCLTEGVRNTADCLSEEKRGGTMGLLFLTDLKGYDVVLGKLMATSLNSVYGLLAIFPPMAIPLVMGGVTGWEVARVALALLSALVFSLGVGMLVSACTCDEHRAWGATSLLVVGLCLIGLLGLIPFGITQFLALFSPATALAAAFDRTYAADSARYWGGLGVVSSITAALLAGASLLLPHSWQDRPRSGNPDKNWGRAVPAASQAARRRRLLASLEENPLIWLGVRREGQLRHVWWLIGVGSVAMVGVTLAGWGFPTPTLAGLALLGFVTHSLLSVDVAFVSAKFFVESRASGAFELLLCTPLGDGEIVQGHIHALERLYRRPVQCLLWIEGLCFTATLIAWGAMLGDTAVVVAAIGVAAWLCLMVSDLRASAWYGMWLGLKSKKTMPAFVRTVLYVLVIPLVAGFCLLIVWPVLGWIKNYLLIDIAQKRLRRSFREIVTGQLSEESMETLDHGWFARRRRPMDLPNVVRGGPGRE